MDIEAYLFIFKALGFVIKQNNTGLVLKYSYLAKLANSIQLNKLWIFLLWD